MPSSLFDSPPKPQPKTAPTLPQMVEEFEKFSKTVTPEEAERKVKELVAEGVIGKQRFSELKNMANSLFGILGKNRR